MTLLILYAAATAVLAIDGLVTGQRVLPLCVLGLFGIYTQYRTRSSRRRVR